MGEGRESWRERDQTAPVVPLSRSSQRACALPHTTAFASLSPTDLPSTRPVMSFRFPGDAPVLKIACLLCIGVPRGRRVVTSWWTNAVVKTELSCGSSVSRNKLLNWTGIFFGDIESWSGLSCYFVEKFLEDIWKNINILKGRFGVGEAS